MVGLLSVSRLVVGCLLVVRFGTIWCHHTEDPRRHEIAMRPFSAKPGVMVNFESPIYINGRFAGFDGWNMTNDKFRATNISYIVRVEFANQGFRENRIRRHFKRFWLPGATWVERSIRDQNIYNRDVEHIKRKNHSHVDIWVEPACFLRHHGISRIHRVAKSMKLSVDHTRWLAKLNFEDSEQYQIPELMQIGRTMVKSVPGIRCTWIHPRIESSFSVMVRFFPHEISQTNFFSTKSGYVHWNSFNNDYQAQSIHFFRGWNRALVDFAGGISCRESSKSIGQRYQALQNVYFVNLDMQNECRFTYQIVVSFNPNKIKPHEIDTYNSWEELNRFYGVVNINKDLGDKWKAIIEFQPGYYNHIQMRALRDEYTKLPGIRFAWVMGKTAVQVSTIILNFDERFMRRMPLRKYHYWDSLNRRYNATITVLEEDRSRAHIRIPPKGYTDMTLKHILSRYRHLPGIESVRMDTQTFGDIEAVENKADFKNTSILEELIPKRRSLESWLEMSRDGSQLSTKVTIVQGLGFDSGASSHHSKWMSRMPAYEHETLAEQCINVH